MLLGRKFSNLPSNPILHYSSIAGYFLFVFLFVFFQSEDNPLLPQFQIDSEVYKYCGWSILDGNKPYIDYFDHKGPLIHFSNALALKISKSWGILIFDFFFLAIVLVLALFFSKGGGRLSMATLFFILISQSYEGGNFTEIIGLPLLMFSFIFLSKNLVKNNSYGLINIRNAPSTGLVFFSICLLLFNKITYAFPICTFFLVDVIFEKNKKRWLVFFEWILYLSICFLAFCLLYISNFGIHSFLGFLDASILFNFKYANGNSGVTYSNLFFDSFVGLIYRPHYWFFLFFIACKLILFFDNREKESVQKLLVFWLLFDLSTLFTIVLGKRGYGHYDLMLLPSLLALLMFLATLKPSKRFRFYFNIIFGLILLFSFQRVNKSVLQSYWRWGASIQNLPDFIYEKSNKPPSVNDWTTKLDSYAPDFPAVTVCKNMCRIYNVLDKRSSSRYFYPVTELNGELLLPDYYKEVGGNLVLGEVLILESGNNHIRLDSIQAKMNRGLIPIYLFSEQVYGTQLDFYQVKEEGSFAQTRSKIVSPISIGPQFSRKDFRPTDL